MSRRIAIIVAMEREIAPLLTDLEVLKAWGGSGTLPRTTSSYLVSGGTMTGTLIAVSGIGRKSVAASTRAIIDNFSPELLISAGLAGALTGALSPGQVLRPAIVIDANSGEKFETARDPKARGVLVTAASVLSREEKKQVSQRFGAEAVDMEAAVVAQFARASSVPFIAVKAVSDPLDLQMLPMDRFIDAGGQMNLVKLIGFAALRPRTWKALGELRRNSQVAAQALAEELERVIVG